jgi:hypothetical protein
VIRVQRRIGGNEEDRPLLARTTHAPANADRCLRGT